MSNLLERLRRILVTIIHFYPFPWQSSFSAVCYFNLAFNFIFHNIIGFTEQETDDFIAPSFDGNGTEIGMMDFPIDFIPSIWSLDFH